MTATTQTSTLQKPSRQKQVTLKTKLIIAFEMFAVLPMVIIAGVVYYNLQTIVNDNPALEEAVIRVNFTVWFIAVALILVSFIVAIQVATSLTSPITKLLLITQQLAAGMRGLKGDEDTSYEASALATNINQLVDQYNELSSITEQRIANRTKQLKSVARSMQTSIRIGNHLATILDPSELLQYAVTRIQSEYNFYFSQIYLVDEDTNELVMAYGSGEIGQQIKAQGYRLEIGQGIPGRAVANNEHILSNDVSKIPYFIQHPLLPLTNSELALPLRKGDKILGVLDIQARRLDRFEATDVLLLQSLSNIIAIAIDNARLVGETVTALREVEYLNRRLTNESWNKFEEEIESVGYFYNRGNSSAITSDSDIWLPPMEQAAASRQLVKHSRPGNGEKPASEMAVPLILRGEVIGVLGVKREETTDWDEEEVSAVEAVAGQVARALENARLSQEQEKTIEQLQEIDRLKSEFLTSMSHELRTPLNSIIGFADVMLQGIDGELNDMAMNDIRLIYNSGQHLLALINDILDISKIEAGMMELVREPISIADTMQDVLAASTSLVKDKPVEILADAEEGVPPVYADKLRLHQILLNIVSNAAKFTHKGSITIKARLNEEIPDTMMVSVIDTGIGIPEDKLETIFDRFQQADSSTTRQYGGTGLGLAICRQLVEMHGGELKVKSTVGEGSEFYFTIPLAETN